MKFLFLLALAILGQPVHAGEFSLLIYEKPVELEKQTDPSASENYWQSYNAYADVLLKAGVMRGGTALDENAGETIRDAGVNKISVARLGGYFVIEAANIQAAREWASKAPASAVAIEIRPHRVNPSAAMAPKQ